MWCWWPAAGEGGVVVGGRGGQVWVAAAVRSNLSYDPQKDLVAIVQLVDTPMVLVVPDAMPVANLADFIALAKSKPGALTFASTGTGTISHLIGDAFKYAADIDILHVPYKGAAQGLPDLLAGQVNAMFTSAAAAHGYLSGKGLGVLALASDVRLPSLPDVPTFAQAGIKDLAIPVWVGLMAPRGVPPEGVDRLHSEFVKVLKDPATVRRQGTRRHCALETGRRPQSSEARLTPMRITVIGAGNIGLAVAAHACHHGHDTTLWSPSGAGTAALAAGQPLRYAGAIEGQARPGVVSDLPAAVRDADVVYIALPATAHAGVFKQLGQCLRDAQPVILSALSSVSALVLDRELAARGLRSNIAVFGSTPMTARRASTPQLQGSAPRPRP